MKVERVRLMTQIYDAADKVVVYLGEAADDSAAAMEVVSMAPQFTRYM
jgi:hypothetical protein